MQRITTYTELKAHLDAGKSISRFSTDIDLRSANLSSADLSSADLSSANLRSADLRSANLRSANLRSADLYSADLYSADLSSANLYSADLRSAKHIVSVTGVGNEGRTAYFVNHANCIMVQAGCFWGTTDELLKRSKAKGDSDHLAGYEAAVAYAKVILGQHRVKYAIMTETKTEESAE